MSKTEKQSEAESKAWDALVDKVYDEIGRSLIHIETGLFSATRAEALHAKVLQLIPKKVTLTDTPSIGFGVRHNGLILLINPDYFLGTLKTTKERSSALRLAEQYIFLMHPFRERDFRIQQLESNGVFFERLYHLSAQLEATSFISGYKELTDAVDASDFPDVTVPKAASAETLYHHFLPLWQEMNSEITKAQSEQRPVNFSKTSAPKSIQEIHFFLDRHTPSDQRHWGGERTYDEQGVEKSKEAIDLYTWELLKAEVERILIVARETLELGKIKTLPKDLHGRLDRILEKYNLQGSSPELAKAAEDEVGAIIIQMMLKDPFFGQFISGCVRQITDTIPTAGVAVLKKYVVLLVNPQFFMKSLKSRAERAAVLKHEALHIMLKHIIQMRNPKFPNKRLYNIAADIEVNQYIGSPWKLPEGAILLTTFPNLKLPPNDVAETYYRLLQEERDKNPNSQASKMIGDMCDGNGHQGGGHSDHRGWEEGQSLTGGGEGEQHGNLNNGINGANDAEMDAHELDIERQVQQARDSLSGKQAGSIPGHFAKLLDDWMKARQPSVDWKRELRLFVSSNPSTTLKRSLRKKNKRYFHWLRQSLKVKRVSADVINRLAHTTPDVLPTITWDMLSADLVEGICEQRPNLRSESQSKEAIPWTKIPLFYVLQLQNQFADLKWPSWDDVPDDMLRRLQLLKTPLDPKKIPMDLVIVIAKEYPKLLPDITWDDFGLTKTREIRKNKNYPHLQFMDKPIWGLLPSEVIVWLQQNRPDLFTLTWKDVPPQLFSRLPYYQLSGSEPFRVERQLKRSKPGTKKERDLPKILVIIDTSASVSDTDIEYLFAEIDAIHKLGAEVHVLQVDTRPVLYFKYVGEKPVAGRGGTLFEPAMVWMNQAKEGGVDIKVKYPDSTKLVTETVKLKVDGAIYLTDGYAPTPTTKPYCRLMWVITPVNATDEYVKNWKHSSAVIHLPPYNKR